MRGDYEERAPPSRLGIAAPQRILLRLLYDRRLRAMTVLWISFVPS